MIQIMFTDNSDCSKSPDWAADNNFADYCVSDFAQAAQTSSECRPGGRRSHFSRRYCPFSGRTVCANRLGMQIYESAHPLRRPRDGGRSGRLRRMRTATAFLFEACRWRFIPLQGGRHGNRISGRRCRAAGRRGGGEATVFLVEQRAARDSGILPWKRPSRRPWPTTR